MATNDSMFELAIELRDKGKLRDSIAVLFEILKTNLVDEKRYGVYTVLGGVYASLKEHENSFTNFKKATELNPKSELASLGVYVTLTELGKDKDAINELIRYLKSYPAILYKTTLEELLQGLDYGYMTNYEEYIRSLASVNGVEISRSNQ